MACGFMVIWAPVELQPKLGTDAGCLLLSLSKRQQALWHLGAKPLVWRQAAALQPSLTGAAFGEHMADPNSCKPSLIKI